MQLSQTWFIHSLAVVESSLSVLVPSFLNLEKIDHGSAMHLNIVWPRSDAVSSLVLVAWSSMKAVQQSKLGNMNLYANTDKLLPILELTH